MATIQRKNTVKITFPSTAPRPSALEIHNWIDETLKITADQMDMIQLHSMERTIYIKLISSVFYDRLVNQHENQVNFQYDNGTIVKVSVQRADVNTVTVRLFNLPPEIDDNTVIRSLSSYGTVRNVRPELWSTQYKFPVHNGVRAVRIDIKKHIPNKMAIAGFPVVLHYPGQPQLCHICGEESHLRSQCPGKKFSLPINVTRRKPLLSDIVRGESSSVVDSIQGTDEDVTIINENNQHVNIPDNTETQQEVNYSDKENATSCNIQGLPEGIQQPTTVMEIVSEKENNQHQMTVETVKPTDEEDPVTQVEPIFAAETHKGREMEEDTESVNSIEIDYVLSGNVELLQQRKNCAYTNTTAMKTLDHAENKASVSNRDPRQQKQTQENRPNNDDPNQEKKVKVSKKHTVRTQPYLVSGKFPPKSGTRSLDSSTQDPV